MHASSSTGEPLRENGELRQQVRERAWRLTRAVPSAMKVIAPRLTLTSTSRTVLAIVATFVPSTKRAVGRTTIVFPPVLIVAVSPEKREEREMESEYVITDRPLESVPPPEPPHVSGATSCGMTCSASSTAPAPATA